MSPSLPIFKDLKLLELCDIFELRLLTIVFYSINETSSDCFHNFFLFSSSVYQYSTRQASHGDLYLTQQNSLHYGLKSMPYLGAKLWNKLPVELRNAPSKLFFKRPMVLGVFGRGSGWRFLAVSGGFWRILAVSGGFWRF